MPQNKLIYGIGRIPKASEFALGEIIINVDDSKAYSKNKSNVVFELVGGGSGGDSDWFIDAGVKLTSSLKIQVDGDVSASGNLYALVAEDDDTNFKTVVYDTATGKFYRTGSYGGGGGSGDTLDLHFSASEGSGFSFENLATASFTSGSGTGLTVTAGSTNNIEFELVGVLSSSAQIATDISGAIDAATGSVLSDYGLLSSSYQIESDISGSWQGQNFVSASQTFLSTGQRSGNSAITGSLELSASGHLTASGNISASGNVIATSLTASNLLITNTASITFLETVYETASVIYTSGSTKFGNSMDDDHWFTGSMLITGSTFQFVGLGTSATQTPLVIDSSGNITTGSQYALSANITTSSLLITASASDTNTIQFTKGDASTFDVIHTASLSQTLTAVLNNPVGAVTNSAVFADGSSIEALLRTMLIEYLPPSLSSLSITSLPSNMEAGDTQVVSAGTFNSSSDSNNAPFDSLALTLANNVNPLVNPSTSALTVSFNPLTVQKLTAGNVTFTLTGTPAQGSNTSTSDSATFRSPIFFGGSPNDGDPINTSVLNSILDDITSSNVPTADGSSGLIDFDSGFGAGDQTYFSNTSTTSFPTTTKLLLPNSVTGSSNYTYIIYPSSYGTLASIYNGAQVETDTFGAPLGEITHTRYTGIDYYVYRSAGHNAYTLGSVLTIDDN